MWTLTLIAFIITSSAYLASVFNSLTLPNGTVLQLNEFDAAQYAQVVLIPLVTAYFARRYTSEHHETKKFRTKLFTDAAQHRNMTTDVVAKEVKLLEEDEKHA